MTLRSDMTKLGRGLCLWLCLGAAACGGQKPGAPEVTGAPGEATKAEATKPAPAPAGGGHDHADPGHVHGAPHGGQTVFVDPYHLELVTSKAGVMLFLLDGEEKTLPVDGARARVLLSNDGAPPIDAAFEPMGNHLHAMAQARGRWVAAVTVEVGGKTLNARFQGDDAAAHGDGHHGVGQDDGAHGGHDHGAHGGDDGKPGGMGATRLSETIEALVTPKAPIVAGQPAELTLVYKPRAGGPALADFQVLHEQRLHLFVVAKDMSFFDHVHPTIADAAAGTWTQVQVFPQPGEYRIYSDFASAALGAHVTMATLVVDGAAPAPVPLAVDAQPTKTYGDVQVTLATEPATLAVGDAMLRYTLRDAAGQPLTDVEPYLGAFGHLFILHEDLVTTAHAHPRGAEPTPELRAGPEIAFHAALPKPGRYKLWAQFQRGGKILTTDFTVEVN